MQIQTGEPRLIIPLRHRVLRAGLPMDSARFDGDEDPGTLHFAALQDDGVVIGCCTLMLRILDEQNEDTMQLRGMAVDTQYQKHGVGRALLNTVHKQLSHRLLWCNARILAASFYERHGWHIISDVFKVPTAEPHVKMMRPPTPSSTNTQTQTNTLSS